MKKLILSLMTISLIGVSLLASTQPVQGAQDAEYAWSLKEVIDIDAQEEIASYNDRSEVYHYVGSYSRNNYSMTSTYIGPSDDWYSPPQVNGENATFTASYSAPPQVIYPGEEITINVSLTAVDNQSFFTFKGHVRPQIGKTGQSFGDFTIENGKSSFTTESKNNYASFNETMTAVAPGGSEGETLEIRYSLYSGVTMQTQYVYEWKMADESAPEIGAYEPPEPTLQPPQTQPDEPEEPCKDSGVRFSDYWGEVLIRPDDDILAWYAVELEMIPCVMDHIKTSYDSGAILSFSDMTTFVLHEESHIVLDTESAPQNKLALLAGKIWVNVKKMVKDGSMNIEMSQAVAGIKGTTLVLEEDGSTSTLKVLEGTVEFTSHAGESLLVTDGQTVSVTDGTFGSVEEFSIEEEMTAWGASKTVDGTFTIGEDIYEDDSIAQDNHSGTGINLILLLLCCAFFAFLIVVAVVIVFLVVKRKQNSTD